MKSLKISLSTLLVAGVCVATFSAQAWFCPVPIFSTYENAFPDRYLLTESILTFAKQTSLKHSELNYTEALGKREGGHLRPVPGVEEKHNEIITQMQKGAEQGANIISNSAASIEGVGNLGDYSAAKSEIDSNLTVRPYSERNGRNYTTAELNGILENQRTAINDFAANAIGMGAAESVNAAGAAAESDPETRAKQVAKAKTLAELYELMLGMDRRIYERSLHVSAVEATNAGVEALQVLAGASATSSGQ